MIITGYAARFDTPDLCGDRFACGTFSFAATMPEVVPLLFDHDFDAVAGTILDLD